MVTPAPITAPSPLLLPVEEPPSDPVLDEGGTHKLPHFQGMELEALMLITFSKPVVETANGAVLVPGHNSPNDVLHGTHVAVLEFSVPLPVFIVVVLKKYPLAQLTHRILSSKISGGRHVNVTQSFAEDGLVAADIGCVPAGQENDLLIH